MTGNKMDRETLSRDVQKNVDQVFSEGDKGPQKKRSFYEALSQLPTALQKQAIHRLLAAIAALFAGVLLAIVSRRPDCLLLVLGAAWMGWMGASLVFDWGAGKIREQVLLCVSNEKTRNSKRATITMRTDSETPEFAIYHVNAGIRDAFIPGVPYLIYTNIHDPATLIAWMAL